MLRTIGIYVYTTKCVYSFKEKDAKRESAKLDRDIGMAGFGGIVTMDICHGMNPRALCKEQVLVQFTKGQDHSFTSADLCLENYLTNLAVRTKGPVFYQAFFISS